MTYLAWLPKTIAGKMAAAFNQLRNQLGGRFRSMSPETIIIDIQIWDRNGHLTVWAKKIYDLTQKNFCPPKRLRVYE